MVIKNVRACYCYLNRVDDNDNYRLRITVSEEQKNQIFDAMEEVAKENGETLSNCEWKGSYKLTEDGDHTFNVKCKNTIKNRNGEISEYKPKVYDIKALEMTEVPNIASGAIVNVEVKIYWTSYKKKFGVMLGLRSVQLLKYEVYSGENPYSDESGENPYNKEVMVDEEDLPFE